MDDKIVGTMINLIVRFNSKDTQDYEEKIGDLIIAIGDGVEGIGDEYVRSQVFSMTEQDIQDILKGDDDNG